MCVREIRKSALIHGFLPQWGQGARVVQLCHHQLLHCVEAILHLLQIVRDLWGDG